MYLVPVVHSLHHYPPNYNIICIKYGNISENDADYATRVFHEHDAVFSSEFQVP